MTPQELWIAERALSYLYRDDANPDVGMGLVQSTAINRAFKDATEACTLFAGGDDFMLLQVDRENIEQFVQYERMK